jgi:hypothetical protein
MFDTQMDKDKEHWGVDAGRVEVSGFMGQSSRFEC